MAIGTRISSSTVIAMNFALGEKSTNVHIQPSFELHME